MNEDAWVTLHGEAASDHLTVCDETLRTIYSLLPPGPLADAIHASRTRSTSLTLDQVAEIGRFLGESTYSGRLVVAIDAVWDARTGWGLDVDRHQPWQEPVHLRMGRRHPARRTA